ncbi:hypothetical protein B296_00037794 [Ensete ventricosum]|uniref:Uncharacterized protein n=1 Tax=Ensete ventricosum TaxID=4639 RepID=A0A426X394_ENSVE|nr:hypothetical protein B296_00037794 [Ensete ventricosum]
MIRSCWELHFGNTTVRRAVDSRSEYHSIAEANLPYVCMIRAVGEVDCFSAHIHLREPGKSKDEAETATEDTVVLKQVVERGEEAAMSPTGLSYPKVKRRLERRWTRRSTTVPQRRIYRSQRKGYRCKARDSMAMGLVARELDKIE